MQRLLGGYTLLEVMLFLAISALIFAFSVVAVQGQAGRVEFRTSADAVNQKFQQWIDQAQNGLSNNPSNASTPNTSCSEGAVAGGNYPQLLNTTPKERGANSDCIFLGYAILVNGQATDSSHIFAIPIVGLRTDDDQGDLSSSIRDAQPIAALNDGTYSRVDLSDTYTIPNGTSVAWARDINSSGVTCSSGNCSYLGGFFTSLSSGNSQGNSTQSLLTVQYPFHDNSANTSSSSLDKCLALVASSSCNGAAAPGGNLWPMNTWQICLESTRTDDWATLSISSGNGHGASTNIQYGKGSTVCS